MKDLLKLTNTDGVTILVGTKSIIDVTPDLLRSGIRCSKIVSRGAMVETNWVIETIEEIYNQSINK